MKILRLSHSEIERCADVFVNQQKYTWFDECKCVAIVWSFADIFTVIKNNGNYW